MAQQVTGECQFNEGNNVGYNGKVGEWPIVTTIIQVGYWAGNQ